MSDATPYLQLHCDAAIGALRLRCDIAIRERWTVLFGPSGSGKSSLLRLIAGLWRPPSSEIVLHGRRVDALPPHKRRICYVAQQSSLFPHRDVEANVRFGASGVALKQRTATMMEYFGVAHLARARVHTLSGGEAQRVALARSLMSAPELLLLDESFTGMHEHLRAELLRLVRDQTTVPSLRILSVTHSVAEAFSSAEEVLLMQDGRIMAQGPCEDVLAEARRGLLRQLGQTGERGRSSAD